MGPIGLSPAREPFGRVANGDPTTYFGRLLARAHNGTKGYREADHRDSGRCANARDCLQRGYDANLTLGHTKNVDILASDPRTGSMYKLEVKTTGYRSARGGAGKRSRLFGHNYEWMMSKKHEEVVDPALFYCFVNIAGEEGTSFRFFIVPSEVVAAYVKDQHQMWLDEDLSHKDTSMRTFRLAIEAEGHPLPTPAAERYENNWSFSR